MPSDCQCSTTHSDTKVVTKRVGNKEAIRKIEQLEAEVKKLKASNKKLKASATKNKVSKDKLVRQLKKKLDDI